MWSLALNPPHPTPAFPSTVPMLLVTPELLLDFWEVLFLFPQGLRQGSGAAGGFQVFGLVGVVAALVAVKIDVDAVHTSKQ